MPLVLVLLLSATIFVSLKGQRVLNTLFALELGAGPFETGLLFAMNGLFPFLLAVTAGRIADRIDNRVLMAVGIAGFSVALIIPYFLPRLGALYVSAAFAGLTSMIFVVATQNVAGVISTTATRTRNFSWYSLGESSANVIGPVLVGLAIDTMHHEPTYLGLAAYTAACGIALAAGWRAIPSGIAPKTADAKPRNAGDLLREPALRNALLTNAAVMAALDLFTLYVPVYARGLGISASTIGLIIGAFGAAGFVTRLSLAVLTARWSERAVLSTALALSMVAFVLFPLTKSALALGGIAFALGLGLGCGQPLTMVLAYNAAPRGRQAEAIAMRLAVSYGSHVFIPPVFGVLGTVVGLGPVFWTCALFLGGGSWMNRGAARRAHGQG